MTPQLSSAFSPPRPATKKNLLVLGAGSAGLIAAISLKRKLPQLAVRVVRSPELGVIGVGEGTTPNFPKHIFDFLGISRKRFHELAEPTWKLGIRFLWGPRGRFDYTFDQQLDRQWSDLPAPNGYYCDEDFRCAGVPAALMAHGRVFPRQPDGCPDIQSWHAFHIENQKFVSVLELVARENGVEIIDGKVTGSERGAAGIAAVHLEDGRRFEADFFVDASGFRSELLGKALEEPFVSFDRALFCDRAVVGGWERTDEPILPYTTAETMDAGWAWQIEHEHHIDRGYVYCSQAISDDAAADEFLRKNPKTPQAPRIVKFRSGCYQRPWVENVVAIGNACGFVEPIEATALMTVCAHTQTLVEFFDRSGLRPTPTMRALYNDLAAQGWTDSAIFSPCTTGSTPRPTPRSGGSAAPTLMFPTSPGCSSSTPRTARPASAPACQILSFCAKPAPPFFQPPGPCCLRNSPGVSRISRLKKTLRYSVCREPARPAISASARSVPASNSFTRPSCTRAISSRGVRPSSASSVRRAMGQCRSTSLTPSPSQACSRM